MTQAADALDAAHRKGLVHRDVKPGNFLIAEGGHERAEHVYLSDFGLTKRAVSDSGITGTGQFVGTLEYAAPEQFEGRRLDAAADVYSLGCVLYECLTGTPPFRRESDAAIMHAHLLEDVPSVSSTRPGVPAALDVVVARAMAKRPSDRYPSAGALATAAQHAVSGAAPPKHAAASPRLRSIVTAAVLLAFLGATVALVLIGSQGREPGATRETSVPGSVALPAGSVTEIDPATRTPVGDSIEGVSISVFRGPETRFHPRMAAGAGGVWVVDQSRVTHVDPQRGEIEAEIPYQSSAGVYASVPDVLAAYRTVWVTSSLGSQELRPVAGVLKRIDPATNEQIRGRVFRGTGGATGVTASMDSIWATFSNGIFLEIDPETLETGGRLELGAGLDAVAASEDDVWVADRLAGTVVRVDPRTGEAGARSR